MPSPSFSHRWQDENRSCWQMNRAGSEGMLLLVCIALFFKSSWAIHRFSCRIISKVKPINLLDAIYFHAPCALNSFNTILLALFHCMVRHGTVRYGSLLGGFPLGTVPGTWYFFSTTSVEVPCEPYRYQNVTCKLCWSLIGLGKSSLLRHWTCDTRPSFTVIPARFKSAQLAKDRTQLLFKQTHIFASTTK